MAANDVAAADSVKYTRLTGLGTRYGSALRYITGNQLFMGPGHLVSVSFTGMPVYEKYVRFYFGDIVSFVYGPSSRQGIYYGLFGILWVFTMGGFALSNSRPFFLAGSFLATILALTLCVLNYWRGERCRFFIRTAVQNVEIPGVATMTKAREVVALLAPLILEAQERQQKSPAVPPSPSTPSDPSLPW